MRMLKVCECENLFGETQYGFRPGRSTTDCILLLLSAVKKAKKKGFKISVAFCDLQKAYDSVDREILYKKLDHCGFGGRVLSMVQSMYYNDSVQIRIGKTLSSPLWFTHGVKQGCALSPLLFALYISGLGAKLQEMKLGVELGGVVLTRMFFADDLILISRTPCQGMNTLLGVVDKYCKETRMSLSVAKTFVLSTGKAGRSWNIGQTGDTLQESMLAKYLGVNIQLRGKCTVRKEKDVISGARRIAHSIMSLTRANLDRSRAARILWESCGIPSILNAVEAMTLSKQTVGAIERIQTEVGNFILQTPRSTSKVSSWTEAGLMPFKYRIWLKVAVYYWRILHRKKDPILKECVKELRDQGADDPWMKL